MTHLYTLAAIALLGYLYQKVLYPAFVSPLSNVPPAHWSCTFSNCWLLWQRYRERENRTVQAAHKKLGDVVRTSPRDISINMIDGGISTVYDSFEKTQWWKERFVFYGSVCCIEVRDLKPTDFS